MTDEQRAKIRAALKTGSAKAIDEVIEEWCKPVTEEPSQAPVLRKSGHKRDDKTIGAIDEPATEEKEEETLLTEGLDA